MELGTVGAALEREHRDIDGGIEEYTAALPNGGGDPAPLIRAMEALRRHIYLEEEFLFPPLREAGMTMPVFVMLREHGELWNAMDAIETQIDAAAGREELLGRSRELLALLDKHNSKEEPIIYPQADAVLGSEAGEKLQAFIESGRMPEGWVCEKA